MAGASPSGSKPEKTMSSRLLTMKFMQRAAATAAAKESSQKPSSTDPNTPSPKRQKLGYNDTTQSPSGTPTSDLEAISAALAAEEEKRREAVTRQAAEAGESEWVLDYGSDAFNQYPSQPPVVVADSLDVDDEDMDYGGRQTYGNYKKKNKNWKANKEPESGSEEEDDEDIDALIKSGKEKANKKDKDRMHQPVRLSKLTSISGGGQVHGGGMSKSQKKRKSK